MRCITNPSRQAYHDTYAIMTQRNNGQNNVIRLYYNSVAQAMLVYICPVVQSIVQSLPARLDVINMSRQMSPKYCRISSFF